MMISKINTEESEIPKIVPGYSDDHSVIEQDSGNKAEFNLKAAKMKNGLDEQQVDQTEAEVFVGRSGQLKNLPNENYLQQILFEA